ncbi:MAG: MFS transporter, partial [Blastocatellia bacterium]|nr:MFS transporter [Blastocatellia bacterium]
MSASVTNGAEELHSSAFALFSACLLIFVALCDAGFVGAITPQIATGLGSSKAVVAASVTLYSIAAASVALWLGKVSSSSKTQGLKPGSWLPNAAFLFAGSSIIAFLSPHISIFLLARAATGVASGLISALAIAALANASSYDRRGKQMIGPAICYFLAPVFGVPMAAFLTATFNWRIVFVFTAFSAVVAGLFVLRYPLPNRAKKESEVTSTSSSLYKMATRSRSTTMGIVGAFFVSGGLVGFTTYIGIWLSEA